MAAHAAAQAEPVEGDCSSGGMAMTARRQGSSAAASIFGGQFVDQDGAGTSPSRRHSKRELEQLTIGKKLLGELCDAVLTNSSEAERHADELRHWCNVAAGMLPANGQARLATAQFALAKASTEGRTLLLELVRFIRLFLEPWSMKSSIISQMILAFDDAKEENRRMLRKLQLVTARLEKFEEFAAIDQWERCFVALQAKRSHGRRWTHLIDDFRAREQRARAEGRILLDDSGDDADTDTDDEGQPLPLKPQKTAIRLPSKEKGPEVPAESEEVLELRAQVEYLRSLSDVPGQANVETQTEGSPETVVVNMEPTLSPDRFCGFSPEAGSSDEWRDLWQPGNAPSYGVGQSPSHASPRQASPSIGASFSSPRVAAAASAGPAAPAHVLPSSHHVKGGAEKLNPALIQRANEMFTVRALDVRGWAGVVPGNLIVAVKLIFSTEVAHSTVAGKVDPVHDRAVFDELDELVLFSANYEEKVEVSLSRRIGAPPMAVCVVPLQHLLGDRSAAKVRTVGKETSATIEIGTTYSLQLEVTPEYEQYRAEALEGATALPHVGEDPRPVLRVRAGWETDAAREHREREREARNAAERKGNASLSSRRATRLNAASKRPGSGPRTQMVGSAEPEKGDVDDHNVFGDTGFLFDPNEDDLAQAKFSMKEVVILAMLHEKQMKAAAAAHAAELRAMREALSQPPKPPTTPPVERPPGVDAECQTDESGEKIVEKVVTNVVEKVIEKKVRVEVEVEKIIEVEKRIYVYPDGPPREVPKVTNQPVRDPLYLKDCPDEFFARLNWFAARKLRNFDKLSEDTRALRDHVLGSQMKALNMMYGVDIRDIFVDDDASDITPLPATYLPAPPGQHWTSRAHAAFHPTTTVTEDGDSPKAVRRTQPPAMFALKGLDLPPLRPTSSKNAALKSMNLSDLVMTRDIDPAERLPLPRVVSSRHGQLRPLVDDGRRPSDETDDHPRPLSPTVMPAPMDFYAPAPITPISSAKKK